jgi:hypothetical protein
MVSPRKGKQARRVDYQPVTTAWSYSSSPSKPAKLRNLPDLNSAEVSQLAIDGLVLYPPAAADTAAEHRQELEESDDELTLVPGVLVKNEGSPASGHTLAGPMRNEGSEESEGDVGDEEAVQLLLETQQT